MKKVSSPSKKKKKDHPDRAEEKAEKRRKQRESNDWELNSPYASNLKTVSDCPTVVPSNNEFSLANDDIFDYDDEQSAHNNNNPILLSQQQTTITRNSNNQIDPPQQQTTINQSDDGWSIIADDKISSVLKACEKRFPWIPVKSEKVLKKMLRNSKQEQRSQSQEEATYEFFKVGGIVRTNHPTKPQHVLLQVFWTDEQYPEQWLPLDCFDLNLVWNYLWKCNKNRHLEGNKITTNMVWSVETLHDSYCQLKTMAEHSKPRRNPTVPAHIQPIVVHDTSEEEQVRGEDQKDLPLVQKLERNDSEKPVYLTGFALETLARQFPLTLDDLPTEIYTMQDRVICKPYDQILTLHAALNQDKPPPSIGCCQCGSRYNLSRCIRCSNVICVTCRNIANGIIYLNLDSNIMDKQNTQDLKPFTCFKCADNNINSFNYPKSFSPCKLLLVIKFYCFSLEAFLESAQEDVKLWTDSKSLFFGYNIIFFTFDVFYLC